MRLASRFGYANQIHRDRPLTREELMQVVPSCKMASESIAVWHSNRS